MQNDNHVCQWVNVQLDWRFKAYIQVCQCSQDNCPDNWVKRVSFKEALKTSWKNSFVFFSKDGVPLYKKLYKYIFVNAKR